MKKNTSLKPHVLALGTLCVVASFAVGIRTSGNVQTIAPSEAGGINMKGDMNTDGTVTIHDAILLLDIAQGYTEPTAEQLLADPNGDGQLTVDDAVRILHDVASR